MRTLGRNGKRRTAGDYRTTCDNCGAEDLRSRLRRRPDGLLTHPNEGPRRDAMTLDRLNAGAAVQRPPVTRRDR